MWWMGTEDYPGLDGLMHSHQVWDVDYTLTSPCVLVAERVTSTLQQQEEGFTVDSSHHLLL